MVTVDGFENRRMPLLLYTLMIQCFKLISQFLILYLQPIVFLLKPVILAF